MASSWLLLVSVGSAGAFLAPSPLSSLSTSSLSHAPSLSASPSLPSFSSSPSRSVCGGLYMAKGKGVPINMRGEMQKRAQMEQMRQQMMGDDSDGLPVFNVFVRSKRAGIWYPAGTLKGDARSKSLVEAWRDNSLFLKDQYKSTLDKGMAKSLFEAKDKFVESVVKMYPQLKNSRAELEFGYRVRIPGLEEKMKAEGREDELKISLLEENLTKGFLDNIKESFGLS